MKRDFLARIATIARASWRQLRRTRWTYVAAVVTPIVLMCALSLTRPPAMEVASNFVFDGYQRFKPRRWTPDSPVRIIDIDEESLTRIGQWPWARARFAEIVERVAADRARVLGFDIVFAEPDRLNPDRLLADVPPGPARAAAERALEGLGSNDARLAAALQSMPVVLGTVLTNEDARGARPRLKAHIRAVGDDPMPWLPYLPAVTEPLPLLAAPAAGLGALNWVPSQDQVIREVHLMYRTDSVPLPSFALELLRVAHGADAITLSASNAPGETAFGRSTGLNAVWIGQNRIATGANGQRRVYYTKSEPGRFVPAWRVIAGLVPKDTFANRIVLVGTSAAGLLDQRATPIDRVVPGVEVHAQLIENVLAGGHLVRPDWAPGAELIVGLLISVALAVIAYRASPLVGAVTGATMAVAISVIGWLAFDQRGLLIDPFYPSLAALVTYLCGVVELYRHERRQKAYVQSLFGRFVSPSVVERLAASRESLRLGGETRDLTLLFCDLRNFTGLSEGLDAAELTEFMNAYLTPMTDVILAADGTVDKYMGDAVMAFWNAPLDVPDHPRRACLAALDMRAALASFNVERAAIDRARGRDPRRARFGIGINTGPCSVGNLGSIHRFDYSAIGDPVNVASRLEGLTKSLGLDILVSEDTVARAPDLAWLDVGLVLVKGKTRPLRVFALIGDAALAGEAAFIKRAQDTRAIVESYISRAFDETLRRAETLAREHAELEPLCRRYVAMARSANAAPGWSPVLTFAKAGPDDDV